MTQTTNLEIGGKIPARCSKCKDITDHIIINFKAEAKVGDVRCDTCGFEHGYRQPRMKKGGASNPKMVAARKQAKLEAEFEEVMKGADLESAIAYNMNVSFKLNDIMEHSVFGTGKVIELITPNKVVVHFKEGPKVLVSVLNTDYSAAL